MTSTVTRVAVLAVVHVAAVFLLYPIPTNTPLLRTAGMPSLSPSTNATAWLRPRLTSLYEATDVGFREAFGRAFSPACEVRQNHALRPLQALRDDLASQRAVATHVSVVWNEDILSANDDRPGEPAVVAGALVVTRSLPIRVRAGPAQRRAHVHFSARIEQDASVQGDDRRRITSFYYTSVDKTPPIHFTVPRAAQEGGSEGQ